jgi:hypothetical protein
MTAIICTIIGFAIAVYNISDETYAEKRPITLAVLPIELSDWSSFVHSQAIGGLVRPHVLP